ncbi:MAG: transposase [Flavobacteriaceae bacterium]|nr:transposase [Flavobacteriaceae bacterium]
MRANVKLLRKHRQFTDEFKKEIISEFESGKFSVCQLEKLHNISNSILYSWIYKFSTFNQSGFRIVEMKASTTNKVKELELKVKELERIVGQKQIQVDYLEKMIDLAKTDLNIDIKKNYNTPQSVGSGKTIKK